MACRIGQGRRGSLGAGVGYCRPLVRPSWCRGSAAAPIRCSGGQVSIWTTTRTIFAVWPLSLEPRRPGLAGVAVPQNCHADRLPDGAGQGLAKRPDAEAVSRSPAGAPMPTPPYQFIAIARTIARGFTEQAIGRSVRRALSAAPVPAR
jgi:hypothetical protein